MSDEQNSPKPQENCPTLVVEGGIKVLYKGVWVTQIPIEKDEITIGVMDPENNIYPDINLRQYRLDGGDPYISRRHAKILIQDGKYYLEDICKNNSTSVDTKSNIVNAEKREIHIGARIFISESLVLHLEMKPKDIGQDNTQVDVSSNEPASPTTPVASSPDAPPKETIPGAPVSPKTEAPKEGTEAPKEGTEAPKEGTEAPKEGTEDTQDAGVQFDQPAPIPYYLEVEGAVPLFFKPRNIFTHIIELNPSEWEVDPTDKKRALQIGRRSTEDSIYPDIDLWKFYFNDGDEYIARRHARIFEQEGKLYFHDISGKGSTWYNQKDDKHRLLKTNPESAYIEIKEGDKLFISDSATFVVHKQ